MKIEQVRIANIAKHRESRAYCISKVFINGKYSHDVIEDYDRGLDQNMSDEQIASIKVYSKTAIPTGRYTVKMNIKSATFSQKTYYRLFCGGFLPRLDPVKGYSGVLIHCGIDENSSAGCLIVGENKEVGKVINSKKVFERIYREMKNAANRKETIEYIITRKYDCPL